VRTCQIWKISKIKTGPNFCVKITRKKLGKYFVKQRQIFDKNYGHAEAVLD